MFRKSTAILFFTILAVLLTNCTNSSNGKTDESSAPGQTDTSAAGNSAEVPVKEDDYLINGFDIRKIGDYPEIEAAIRKSANAESGELTKEDFLGVTSLNIAIMDIPDITPLAALTNLTELYARCNNIVDVSPLSGLTKLVSLDLLDNEISDLSPLSGLVNLTDAKLGNNKISDITPLSGWEKIERLSLDNNPLTDISALRNLNLFSLMVTNCPIEDFSPVDHVGHVEPWHRNDPAKMSE